MNATEHITRAYPTFSVIVPLYNKRPYIRRAVDSVLTQTITDFELIIVDDGSTDGSAEELADVTDYRLKLVSQANQGAGVARNMGLSFARGSWMAFLDADDAWMPSHLQELNRIAQAHPSAGLISTTCMEAFGSAVPTLDQDYGSDAVIREVDYFLEASRNIGFVNSTSSAVRSDVVEGVRSFSSRRTGEDLEFWIKLALKYPVAVSSRVTCVYFRDTGGVMQQVAQRNQSEVFTPSRSLRELSTPVAVLCDEADKDPTLWQRPSVRRYFNGVVQMAIKGAIYREDLVHARVFSRSFLDPLSFWQRVQRFLVSCPGWMLGSSIRLVKWTRSFPAFIRRGSN